MGTLFYDLPSLDQQLLEEPFRFGFFQAVRVLHRRFPERQAIGGNAPPMSEVVRFRAHMSMAFPPSEICDLIAPSDPGRPHVLVVAFLGLTGPSGALPQHYTDLLLERARRHKDTTLRDFLDLFNHRLISLFYRAWEKYRFWIQYEHAEREARKRRLRDPGQHRSFVIEHRPRLDLFSQSLLQLTGMGPAALRYRLENHEELERRRAFEDETLRFYAGLLAQQHRSALGLEGLLQDYFGLPLVIQQLQGQWLQLDPENQSCLTEGGNVRLGIDVVIGERVWEVQSKFRIRLGPLTYRQFHDFLPLGTAFRPLADLSRLYAGAQFDIDVQLVLLAAEVPWCQLADSEENGARLGWNTWIRTAEFERDVDDAVFVIHD